MSVGDMNVCVFLYADNSVLFAENQNDLQWMLERLYDAMSGMHLKRNASKRRQLGLWKWNEWLQIVFKWWEGIASR